MADKKIPAAEGREIMNLFDELTDGGKSVGFTIKIPSDDDLVTSMKDVYFHTIGLSKLNLPEIVILLGPRSNESPYPVKDCLDVSKNVIDNLKSPETLRMLSSGEVKLFTTKGIGPRRFSMAPISQEQKQLYKELLLGSLTEYLEDSDYDIVLFEPLPWIH